MESQLNQLSDTTIRRIVGYGRRLDLYEGFGGFVRECAERYSGHMRLASVVLLPSLFAGVARSQSIIGRVLDGTDSLVVAGAGARGRRPRHPHRRARRVPFLRDGTWAPLNVPANAWLCREQLVR